MAQAIELEVHHTSILFKREDIRLKSWGGVHDVHPHCPKLLYHPGDNAISESDNFKGAARRACFSVRCALSVEDANG